MAGIGFFFFFFYKKLELNLCSCDYRTQGFRNHHRNLTKHHVLTAEQIVSIHLSGEIVYKLKTIKSHNHISLKANSKSGRTSWERRLNKQALFRPLFPLRSPHCTSLIHTLCLNGSTTVTKRFLKCLPELQYAILGPFLTGNPQLHLSRWS